MDGLNIFGDGSRVYMFTFMGLGGELLLYQRILLPKAKIFVVELAYNSMDDVVSFADRDSRWVLSPRVFSKIFCH